jgi:hypothetical protein
VYNQRQPFFHSNPAAQICEYSTKSEHTERRQAFRNATILLVTNFRQNSQRAALSFSFFLQRQAATFLLLNQLADKLLLRHSISLRIRRPSS